MSLIYSLVLEILCWISSFPSGLLPFMFIGKTSLWLGDHAGLCSHQTPLQYCSPPDVRGWLPDQILGLTGAPDKHFSIANSSCYFEVFSVLISHAGSLFVLCFHLCPCILWHFCLTHFLHRDSIHSCLLDLICAICHTEFIN